MNSLRVERLNNLGSNLGRGNGVSTLCGCHPLFCPKGKGKGPRRMRWLCSHRRLVEVLLRPIHGLLCRKGCSAPFPGRFTPGKDQVPVMQGTGRARKICPPAGICSAYHPVRVAVELCYAGRYPTAFAQE